MVERGHVISDTVSMSTRDLELLLQVSVPVPWTPKCQSPAQDVPDLVALFPQTALLLSPAISDEAVHERFQGIPAGAVSKTEYKSAAFACRCECALC